MAVMGLAARPGRGVRPSTTLTERGGPPDSGHAGPEPPSRGCSRPSIYIRRFFEGQFSVSPGGELDRSTCGSARDVLPGSVQFSVAGSVQFSVAIDSRNRSPGPRPRSCSIRSAIWTCRNWRPLSFPGASGVTARPPATSFRSDCRAAQRDRVLAGVKPLRNAAQLSWKQLGGNGADRYTARLRLREANRCCGTVCRIHGGPSKCPHSGHRR